MEGFRRKFARSGVFAALFFALFAILASFHHHENSAGEPSNHHCAVCHSTSASKALTKKPSAFEAPTLSHQRLEILDAASAFAPAPIAGDPIRGPPSV